MKLYCFELSLSHSSPHTWAELMKKSSDNINNPFMPTVPTFAVRETASLGIMGAPRVPPLNPTETIVLSEHYRFSPTDVSLPL